MWASVVSADTRLDLYATNSGCCAKGRFGAEAPSYPGVDLPASALLDTLLLPLSVLTVLGIGFNATGGL
ncbi:YceK/YidQ family lipoprotein [Pseudomonas sp. KBW05]|nr:YceK/YidQ family lipoprotein [Pseudomonas sp. KBW05]